MSNEQPIRPKVRSLIEETAKEYESRLSNSLAKLQQINTKEHNDLRNSVQDNARRISRLENWKAYVLGAAAAVVSLGAALFAVAQAIDWFVK